ncbi:cell division protein FtsA [Sutterella sp.]|uniref:cell division protein FtsA n=1 Tax=Sutterella sp. TaxID=1981025 RepID=UPI0026DFEC3A|nr:cell division protein FtsA [Sutterella sp.]MDO5530831.1 cell division protein FtsA [Sutterella sp.]
MKQQRESQEFFTALDVGSDRVICLVARPGAEPGTMRVMGIGDQRSRGVANGCVNIVSEAVEAIREAIREAQATAEVQILGVWTAIGGGTLESANCSGQTVLRGREVTREDMDLAEENARQSAIHGARGGTMLKLIPQGFRCGDVVSDRPEGLVGERLEANVHALYGSSSNVKNLKRCIERAGVELLEYEPHPWAAAKAALTESERMVGTALIDIGAETSSMIVFTDGLARFSCVRPFGASLFTGDLSVVLGIDLEEAEELKLNAGDCRRDEVLPDELVQFDRRGVPSRSYSRDLLVQTLSTRAINVLRNYRDVLVKAGHFDDIRLVVLTGGGAKLPGFVEEAQKFLGKRVRLGIPLGVEGETPLLQKPDSAVAAGLIRCAIEQRIYGPERAYGARRSLSFMGKLKTFFVGDY